MDNKIVWGWIFLNYLEWTHGKQQRWLKCICSNTTFHSGRWWNPLGWIRVTYHSILIRVLLWRQAKEQHSILGLRTRGKKSSSVRKCFAFLLQCYNNVMRISTMCGTVEEYKWNRCIYSLFFFFLLLPHFKVTCDHKLNSAQQHGIFFLNRRRVPKKITQILTL